MTRPLALTALLLGLAVSLAQGQGQVVRLMTPQAEPAAPVRLGLDTLEQCLSEEGHTVVRHLGEPPSQDDGATLEIILSPFDPQSLPANQRQTLRDVVVREPGAFSLMTFPQRNFVRVYAVGFDSAGTLYAAYELERQLRQTPAYAAFATRIEETRQRPAVPVRGVRRWLSTDALQDAFSWFHTESFWEGYLDLLSRSRLNMLELQGVIHPADGSQQDLWPFFTTGNQGIASTQVNRNRASLRRILTMAQARAIHVVLTASAPNESSAGQIEQVFPTLVREFPRIDGIGLALETNNPHLADTLNALLPALNQLESPPLLMLESPFADAAPLEQIVQRYSGRAVARLSNNSTRLGLPYWAPSAMTGGSEHNLWRYLKPGHSFGILFSIALDAFQGLFPWGDPAAIRSMVQQSVAGGSSGFILEKGSRFACVHASCNYLPEEYQFSDWTYQQDWYSYALWGLLGYQPDAPRERLRQLFTHRFGEEAGPPMLQALEGLSRVMTAINAVHPNHDPDNAMPVQLRPPPGLGTLISAAPADPMAIRPVREEAALLQTLSQDGRRSPWQTLEDAALACQEAIGLLDQALQSLNPQGNAQNNLLDESALSRYREVQGWKLDAGILQQLARTWRDQVNAAVQYALYRDTGDVPSLSMAVDYSQPAKTAWDDVLQQTQAFPRLPVRTQQGVRDLHWNDAPAPFEQDRAALTQDYNQWLERTALEEGPGHFSPPRITAGKPLVLALSFPPAMQVTELTVTYRTSSGRPQTVAMQPSRLSGVNVIQLGADEVTPGRIEYFFQGRVNGEEQTWRNPADGDPYFIAVLEDAEPPQLLEFTTEVNEGNLEAMAAAMDPSGLEGVMVRHRPLDGSRGWQSERMRKDGSQYRASLPVPESGALVSVELQDIFGNIIRLPGPLAGAPYRIVLPQ